MRIEIELNNRLYNRILAKSEQMNRSIEDILLLCIAKGLAIVEDMGGLEFAQAVKSLEVRYPAPKLIV